MTTYEVSLQIVMEDDVDRLLVLFDIDAAEIYHAHLSVDGVVSMNEHAIRAVEHVKHRVHKDATLVLCSHGTNATRRDREMVCDWVQYMSAVLHGQVVWDRTLVVHVVDGHDSCGRIQNHLQTDWTSTITFSASTESFTGMQVNGHQRTSGYTTANLDQVQQVFSIAGYTVEDIALGNHSGTGREGRMLIIRGAFLEGGLADAVAMDLQQVVHPRTDRKAMMHNVLKNRHARYCACLGETSVESDLANGVGVVVSFGEVPAIAVLRKRLGVIHETSGLLAEVNYYYDAKKCYIGFHGDGERPDVMGAVIGQSKILAFQGFQKAVPVGERVELQLNHGDVYIGCEVAFGHHWKHERCRSNCVHYRHAAYQPGNPAVKSNRQILEAVSRRRR